CFAESSRLIVTSWNGRPRYIRFIVTNSGSSATQGPHQVAQTLITVSFLDSPFTSRATSGTSIGSSETGSASHLANAFRASACFSAHLVEQPKTRVLSTGTGLPARRAKTAFRASCDLTVLTSASSNRPTYRSLRAESKT